MELITGIGVSDDRTTFPKVTNDGSDVSGLVINDSSQFVFSRSLLTITVDVNVIHFINYRRPDPHGNDDDGRTIYRWSSIASIDPRSGFYELERWHFIEFLLIRAFKWDICDICVMDVSILLCVNCITIIRKSSSKIFSRKYIFLKDWINWRLLLYDGW